MLRRSGGLDALSKQLDVPPAVAAAGAEAVLPAILGGFRKHTENAGGGEVGLGNLVEMLGSLGGGGLAANVLGPDPTDIGKGNAMLEQIFGSKDVSRSVAADAAGRTGIQTATLEKMLPILAMLVGGYLSARAGGSGTQGSGGLGDLGSILTDFLSSNSGSAPVLASPDSLRKLGSLLDINGNGNPLDEIISVAEKLRQ
ncbi:MAG: DUF937 domain-containing protein [Sphingomonadales bacterium]|nr:DUF937 domain-containing protein [Sphingomonadales bacterium]